MIKKLFLFSLYTYIILVNYLTFCNAKISDKRLCADPECSSILSYATTLLRYFPSDECSIQFPANVKVNVMSKGAGTRKDLWEIEFNGKRGYVPSNLLRETQILKRSIELIYEVPTQCGNDKETEEVGVEQQKIDIMPTMAASAVEPVEVIDGKKLFSDEVVNVTVEKTTVGDENIVETPALLPASQPLSDDKPDNTNDQDYDAVDIAEEEEIIDENEDGDEESEETVDSNFGGETVRSDTESKNESVETTSGSISNENVSIEVEAEIKIHEKEILTNDPVDVKPDTATGNVSSTQAEITSETPQNMFVTENPNEIPRPILENQILLEATTSTPFLESITETVVPETVLSNTESSSKSEEDNSTKSEDITSEIPPVPSVEENNSSAEINQTNQPKVIDEPAAIKEEEFEIKSELVEPEKLPESNPIGPEAVLVQPNPVEIPVAYPPPPPPGFYAPPPESKPTNVDNKIDVLEQNLVVEENSAEDQPINNNMPEYTSPPSPQFDEIPPSNKDSETVQNNIDNKIEDLRSNVDQEEFASTESVEEQVSTEIPSAIPLSPPSAIPPLVIDTTPPPQENSLPQENPTPVLPVEPESPGLFARIYAKIFGSGSDIAADKQNIPLDEELERILYPEKFKNIPEPSLQVAPQDSIPPQLNNAVDGYCENLSPNACPQSAPSGYTPAKHPLVSHFHSAHTDLPENCTTSKGINYEEYVKVFLDGILKMKDFIIYLTITAATVLSFMFGYYCINKCRKESPLINNLNVLERNLMVSKKENVLLQGELDDIRQKLASIEDNSFGSNEMVIALKTQLDESENHKMDYQLQVSSLEKELESATEAGLELNRMVAELLNNQSGSDSIISSVEELQKQLNEQQETILSINTTLAEKSRENSELQVFLNEQKKQFDEDLSVLQSLNENLTETNGELNKKISEMTETLEVTVNEALKSKSEEIVKLSKELGNVKKRYEDSQRKLAKAESRCQVLDEYLKNAKKDTTDAKEVYDLVQLKSDALAANKEKEQIRERLESETDARKLLEDHLKVVSEEVSNLKKEYHVAEKEKVEAQTRLEVLSGYFKEKETQLQKELSIKEAMWLQQQGEKTSTIERVQSMQDEIQNLKSQNDALRAEIEAQAAAHKTQIATLDSRAHEEWLSAKQAKRKLEEVRAEAAGLRRKLTTFGESGVVVDGSGIVNGIDGNLNAPSPILMVGDNNNPAASMLGVLPPPPFMPPPFMGPPPPFMPPPFMPGEMRPPPLGRLMSPPPNRYSPNILDDRDRYSPNRSPGRYSPDARYNYNDVLSPYETETDFSPPPSPPPRHGGYRDNRGYKAYSPPPPSQSDNRNKKSKGGLSSGSTDSLPRRRGGGGGDNAGSNNQNGSNKV